ncbi:MAG: SDR family NAD(P)-dependent oxidoreductase [Granulosicoccus sp.]|nr:SDR family NAD(P)-dependent oxidoreductase [Granulosicoccus sp.]
MHTTIRPGHVAVVTGGASGIGLAAVQRFLETGMKVCIVDIDDDALAGLHDAFDTTQVLCECVDASDMARLESLYDRIISTLGPVDVLLNNAGIQPGSSIFDKENTWQRIIEVNLWGVIRCTQVFTPRMLKAGRPGLIINTGSKQGITTPPGDPAYNVAKAGVKAFTEALQHDLRNRDGAPIEARLFIPGFVFTSLTANGRTEKPEGAWTPEQVVDYLFDALGRDDFYILCPDNDVDRATDEKRIKWAAEDLIQNRPPLSRWHPDYADEFAQWMKK